MKKSFFIKFLLIILISTHAYSKKVVEDYSTNVEGKSGYCYAKGVAMSVAKSNAKNNLIKRCEAKGWSYASNISFAQTAYCTSCRTDSNYRCTIIAKGWCHKYTH